ncbi:MAG: glycoside hydrolase family 9 protein [Ruminococcus sp.]|nr:glycoside hydrolase family 9 protein [Ruminococcus sp.]
MHKKLSRAIAGSLMSAAMLATALTGVVAPITASAGQVLGETTFEHKALPWHTCESSPAKQDFEIKDGEVHITVLTAIGADNEKWDLQFRHRNLNFKAGHTYKVSFKAKAKRNGMQLCSKIGDISGDNEYFVVNGDQGTMQMGPHMGGQWGNAAKLTTSYQTYAGTFTPTQDLEGVEWSFHYAKGTKYEGNAQDGDEIWFDEMSIECETCNDCDADPNNSYGAVNRDYSTAVDSNLGTFGATKNFISVNQIGYYPNLKKVATLGDNGGDILYGATKISLSGSYDFELVDANSGDVVYTGKTSEPKADKDSGDKVCTIDFSEYDKPGRYYLQIKGQDWRSFEFNIGDNIYYDESHNLLTNAMNYFYQNRSGIDIEDKYCTSGGSDGKGTGMGHQGGHKTDTATIQKIWKNEYSSKEEATSTYKSGTLTANGGWYDAGDHGKYVVNGGISIWTLQNMYERAIQTEEGKAKFADGSGTVVVPEAGNKVPDVLDEAAVELDWIAQMKVTSSDSAWGKYEGLYYHKLHDHKWTGLATKPWDYEGDTLSDGSKGWGTVRIVKPPTFAATLNYAACAAQAARLWEPYDSAKAKQYLESAKEAFEAYQKYWYPYDDTKTTHPTLKCECPQEELNENSLYAPMWHAKGGGPYGDDNVLDDAYWAACEIFVSASKMGDTAAASTYKKIIDESDYAYNVSTRMVGGENKDGSFTSFNWGNTASAGSLTLALNSDLLSDSENSKIKETILAAADEYMKCESEQGYGIPYKYDGPDYNDPNNLDPSVMINGYEWGSNSMVINNCIVMAYAYDLTKDINYMNGVATGLDYLFGRNPLSYSYVTGYGTYKEHNPHHRYWSYELDKSLPMAPDGILSGGPNAGLQDPYVRALGFVPGNTANPSQRCFVDSIEAWSTNEVTINWNSPLAWIASFMQDEAAKADPNNKGEDNTTKPTTSNEGGDKDKILWGDANVDNEVNVSDAVLIMQTLSNPDEYQLSAQGRLNADVVDNGSGVTAMDALAIQCIGINLITQPDFPTTTEVITSFG